LSDHKYLKTFFEKGFAIVTEKDDKKESWFPGIDLFDSNGDYFDSSSYEDYESPKLFNALLKISQEKDPEGVELIYSEPDGKFVIRIDDCLYFFSAPRDYLRKNIVHESYCEDSDIVEYLKTISVSDLLKDKHNAVINPENARELINQIKTLA